MQPHKIVSESEWVAARKAHLAVEKKFTEARDELSRQRRELPWVKVDKPYVFDGPARQGDAGRAVRRAQPADRLSLHVRPGLGTRLPELLVPLRSLRRRHRCTWRSATSPCSRFRARRCRRSKRSRSGWDGASSGCRHSAAISIATTTCRSRKDELEQSKAYYNYRARPIPRRRSARRQRVLQGRGGRHLPHLFGLRARARHPGRHLQPARPGAEGPRRSDAAVAPWRGCATTTATGATSRETPEDLVLRLMRGFAACSRS